MTLSEAIIACCLSVMTSQTYAIERLILTSQNPELALEHTEIIDINDNPFRPRCSAPPASANVVYIDPGFHEPSLFSKEPEGTTFVLKAGVHRIRDAIKPHKGMQFYGEFDEDCHPLTILRGSQALTDWRPQGDLFFAEVQNPPALDRIIYKTPEQVCEKDAQTGAFINPRCNYPEDLFKNNQWMIHVASRDDVVPGAWYFDYENGVVYVHKDDMPTNQAMELSLAGAAFQWRYFDRGVYKPKPLNAWEVENTDVGIYGLIVENFATHIQHGAIGGQWPAAGWRVENNIVRRSHSIGIRAGAETIMRYNQSYENGDLGIGALYAMHSLIDGNVIYDNNKAYINWEFEGGGGKFLNSYGLRITRNCVFNNKGPGLWSDVSNEQTIYQWNIVFDNLSAGLFHEISFDAKMLNNLVGRNGAVYGGQLFLSNSQNVEVRGNIIEEHPDKEGGSVALSWSDRGVGKRFDTRLVDERGVLLPRIEAPWETRQNKIIGNRFYNYGESYHDLFIHMDAKKNGERESIMEEETLIDQNQYFSNNPSPYVWKINRHSSVTGSFPRLSFAGLQELGFETLGQFQLSPQEEISWGCQMMTSLTNGEDPHDSW
ncbi:right-handed parallel beta-helix repeat-containing protein [Hahella aquimaris]|uniref:right-handed parallel beta-helix repeat-containing protein n=1 Tax=Hahella sp. HNIBRBA332 TaxID=3015983 RepID=UPI00273C10E3|nr:right-handed parallel beta-helix repeat-containing protein [Hahella sp. HNIBRBA332]WLQ13052.1 right-handed parallel beta-helix repeat-containing protein [Hahella sp. HNIBRBA332]